MKSGYQDLVWNVAGIWEASLVKPSDSLSDTHGVVDRNNLPIRGPSHNYNPKI